MWNIRFVAFISGVLGVFLLSSVAVGDGFYSPEAAYQASVGIPLQRAIVVHRDGVETLVVESTMETASPTVGWILPLPAPPTSLEVDESRTLWTFLMGVHGEAIAIRRPDLNLNLFGLHVGLPLLWCIVAIGGIVFALWARGLGWLEWSQLVILVGTAALPMYLIFRPSPTINDRAQLDVLREEQVGSYNVSVLRAESSGALVQWLGEQDLRPLDDVGRRLVDDYVGRGWCFTVARLRRDRHGFAAPHPLRATFPAAQPIYPMKLSSLAGSRTRVELLVISDRLATAEGFRIIAADWFYPNPRTGSRYYHSKVARFMLMQPAAPLLWDGCFVTRLQGDLAPEDMDRDITFVMEEPAFRQERRLGSLGAAAIMELVSEGGLSAFLIGAALVHFRGRRPRRWQRGVLTGVMAATVVVVGLIYLLA